MSAEHSEFRWSSAPEALALLTAADPSTQWARRVIQRAEAIRELLPGELIKFHSASSFEMG